MKQKKKYRVDKDLGVFLCGSYTNNNLSKLQALDKYFSSQKFRVWFLGVTSSYAINIITSFK